MKQNQQSLQGQDQLTHSVTSIKHFTFKKKNTPNILRTYRQQGPLIDTSTCGGKTKQELKGMQNKPRGPAPTELLLKLHLHAS